MQPDSIIFWLQAGFPGRAVIPFPEDGGTDSYESGTFGNGGGKVPAHTHGQFRQADIQPRFNAVPELPQRFEYPAQFSIPRFIGGHCHQSGQLDIRGLRRGFGHSFFLVIIALN